MNTNTSLVKLQADMPGQPQVDQPHADRAIAGRPLRHTWNVVDAPSAGATMSCGVWHCEPGHWRIAFPLQEHELFTVLEGRCRVHSADGTFQEAGPGQALFIPGGFVGSFEVLEPLKKTYAIVSAAG
ncbi:MAG: cupin domain-containing protein [Rubrivivax sp.]